MITEGEGRQLKRGSTKRRWNGATIEDLQQIVVKNWKEEALNRKK